MKFIDYAAQHLNCATYKTPGVVTSKTMQCVVMNCAQGKHPTYADFTNEQTVLAMGKWLRDLHEASRKFK